MRGASAQATARAVLELYPRSYAQELGVRSLETPSGLYRLLVMATLMSARIRASVAVDATRALFRSRWTTAKRMGEATWEERTRVLNKAGYARYDESTSRMLGDTAEFLLTAFGGDLRRLRVEAGRDPAAERRMLKQCKGIGDVGVDIFNREVQRSWTELYPFADRRALTAAKRLGVGSDARDLTGLAQGDDFVRLVNNLARIDVEKSYDEV